MPIRLNAERLRAAARQHGDTTDTMIANRTGVSGSTISRLARPGATQNASVATFHALGAPYGLKVDELILTEDDKADAEPEALAA